MNKKYDENLRIWIQVCKPSKRRKPSKITMRPKPTLLPKAVADAQYKGSK